MKVFISIYQIDLISNILIGNHTHIQINHSLIRRPIDIPKSFCLFFERTKHATLN